MMLVGELELTKMAIILREAYGLPLDAELWMRPVDLIAWYDQWLKQARDRGIRRYPVQ